VARKVSSQEKNAISPDDSLAPRGKFIFTDRLCTEPTKGTDAITGVGLELATGRDSSVVGEVRTLRKSHCKSCLMRVNRAFASFNIMALSLSLL
jgi:hypothetical protein